MQIYSQLVPLALGNANGSAVAMGFFDGMFVLGGEEALAFHLVFGGQFEREYRRGCPVGACPLDRPLDDGAVANVDAVKKAHGHGTDVCIAQRKRHKL